MAFANYLNPETFKEAKRILKDGSTSQIIKSISQKIIRGDALSREEFIYLLGLKDSPDRKALFNLANAVRRDNVGETIFIKGIIEFSNYCKRDCTYCGIRASCKVKRYRMEPDEIVEVAIDSAKHGIDTIILQSGEDPFYTTDIMIDIIKRIKVDARRPISLSIGERTPEEFKLFKEVGASRCLLKQETINPYIFKSVHGSDYEIRISLLKMLVSLGYIAGGGNIIGLPNQTLGDIADDIIFMRDIGIKMTGIGPFIPTKNTPLENHPVGSADITLNAYACTRLAIPTIFMPTTTALGTIDPGLQYEGFEAGCNVIMVNFTPDNYRQVYRIYDNKRKVEFYETVHELLKRGKKLSFSIMKALREEEMV